MSEHEYWELQAINQPPGEKDLCALRDLCWRTGITSTTFQNTCDFGNWEAALS